ncbi:Hypothetical protein A7982_01864 [Minicystis rosea]|nr:Hypothetical protein A7982_01864 [Minicystis rosea]
MRGGISSEASGPPEPLLLGALGGGVKWSTGGRKTPGLTGTRSVVLRGTISSRSTRERDGQRERSTPRRKRHKDAKKRGKNGQNESSKPAHFKSDRS